MVTFRMLRAGNTLGIEEEFMRFALFGFAFLLSTLVAPQMAGAWPRFRVWCDPTFGPYLEESLGTVVTESGGNYKR